MNIKHMLNELKDILPAENFKIQPTAAHEELLQFEKEYNINTSQFVEDKDLAIKIPEDIREKWIQTLDTFIHFNGNINDLNHLPANEKNLNNEDFIDSHPSFE